jgi:hypothetical protein
MKINDGKYTGGKSFRAIAELNARKYRVEKLKLKDYDKYGHILTDKAASLGFNYLPSCYFRFNFPTFSGLKRPTCFL